MEQALVEPQRIFLEAFITKYGAAIQVFGFLGWFVLSFASIAIAVALFLLLSPAKGLALDYRRYVDYVTATKAGKAAAPTPEGEPTGEPVAAEKFAE
ncbi:MAG: hypothetical protein OEV43_04925 [Coriobacteriia bacterium]|nr:hypothetical protein [Coriobacteriia bacterium]